MSPSPLLSVESLSVTYRGGFRTHPVHAVREVSLTVQEGETFGVVGESGSGKSTLGSAILGRARVSQGKISFAGQEITDMRGRERRQLGRQLQAVFQDPYSSLNPVRTIGQSLAEPLLSPAGANGHVRDKVADMLARVGLPADAAEKYPAEFSGGQRQRIAIGRALIVGPQLVICDEPVSSLDVSVQAQVLNLLTELQATTGTSYLFISHNLTIVRHIAHRVLVLYRGMVMEEGDARDVCDRPQHPYSQALLAAVPVPDPCLQQERRAHRLQALDAAATTRANAQADEAGADATGADGHSCPFADRCPHVVQRCRQERPVLRPGRDGVLVACHRFESVPEPEGLSGLVAMRSREL